MKNTLFLLAFSLVAIQVKSQTIDASNWCVQSIQLLTDTNGIQYTQVELSNNEVIFDSAFCMISIEGLMHGTDTITPSDPSKCLNYWDIGTKNTTMGFRIDTTLSLSDITGILVRRGSPGCGIVLMESIIISKLCESDFPLGSSDFRKPAFTISPNPSTGIMIIKGQQVKTCRVKVFAANGMLVFNADINVNSGINLSQLSKGMYYIAIEGQFVQKLILE